MSKPIVISTVRIPTEKIAIISTAHITSNDNDILSAMSVRTSHLRGTAYGAENVFVNSFEYGFYIPISDEAKFTEVTAFSLEFRALYVLCQDQGISVLCLDRDGVEVPGLPKFNW